MISGLPLGRDRVEMRNASKDNASEGKLPIDTMESILDSIPTTGLLVPNRMGMDAAIVPFEGETIFCFSRVAYGLEGEKGTADRVISALEQSAAKFGNIIVIDPVVLFPPGLSIDYIRKVVLGVAEAARNHGITVGKGHTEITSKVNETTLIATVLGSMNKQ